MKKLFDVLYGWAVPSLSSALATYKENVPMTNLVKTFYLKLQSNSLWFALILLLSFVMFYYYGRYNSKPGRHYKWQKWVMFMAVAVLSAFVLSLIIGAFIKCPIASLWWRNVAVIAGLNSLYVFVFYWLWSFIWSQIPPHVTKTNAYLWMKIRRK